MIQKRFVEANGRTVARVTFTLPSRAKSKTMYLVGDFNDWDPTAHPFRRDTKGRWTLTLDLKLGRAYQFRYRHGDEEWMHDAQADAFVFNPHGTYNFIVVTDPDFNRYHGA